LENEVDALVERYQERARQDRATLEGMVTYARSGLCRWRLIMAHFGETPSWDRCGHCDSCILAHQEEHLLKRLHDEQSQDESLQITEGGSRKSDGRPPYIDLGHLPTTEFASTATAPAKAPNFKAGQQVRVRRYGLGEVVATT